MIILGFTEEDRMTLCNCVETQLTTTVTPVTSGTAAAAAVDKSIGVLAREPRMLD